jgi:hypothetical protein
MEAKRQTHFSRGINCGKAATLLLLMGAVGFVLLILRQCGESSAGASRRGARCWVAWREKIRLVRQFLCGRKVFAGVRRRAGGLLVALWGSDALVALSGDQLPRLATVPFDYRVFGFLALVCLLTGILFGAAPALAASRTNLQDGLQESGRTSSGRGQRKFRSLVVVGEIALALMLTMGAGLLMKTFLSVAGINSGFVAENVLTLQVSLPRERYPQGTAASRFYQPVRDRVLAIPGVRAAGWTALPFKNRHQRRLRDRGRQRKAGKAPQGFRVISPGYSRSGYSHPSRPRFLGPRRHGIASGGNHNGLWPRLAGGTDQAQ